MRIGVLALQGAFIEHERMLSALGAEAMEVRLPRHLAGLNGLIIPGGESTTMGRLAEEFELLDPLRQWVSAGRPTWGTCAGMILLANRATNQKLGGQPLIGGLDVLVNRNYFGRQLDSFEAKLDVPALESVAGLQAPRAPFPAVFIRAPAILEVGPTVEVLATLPEDPDAIVAVRQGPLLATAFHPELTNDTRFHQLFLSMAANQSSEGNHAPAHSHSTTHG